MKNVSSKWNAAVLDAARKSISRAASPASCIDRLIPLAEPHFRQAVSDYVAS